MAFQVNGEIDIVPPLAWSEVQPAGFAVMDQGFPVVPVGQWFELVPTEELLNRAEGTLHRFTFAKVVAASAEIPDADKETFRAQLQTLIAAFPTHVFGGVSRAIRFRGDLLDDQWRVRIDNDGVTVRRQAATLTWTDAI